MASEAISTTGSSHKLTDKMTERVERVGHKLDELTETAQDLYGRGKERAQLWRDNMNGYVQDRPMKSLLVAAGIGLVFGVLLARR